VPKVFRVQTFTVQEAHGFIWFWNGEPRADYPPLPWCEELDDSFEYGTVAVKWNSHYTRSIENQLDVSHLPFVHKNTIGRGNRTLVNGPYVTLENNTLTVNFNRLVLHEDQKVVETQRPKIASLDIGERFIPGDRPIALFLIHRRDLILAAQKGDTAAGGQASVARADAEIDWSMAEDGEIHPSLPYDLRRRPNRKPDPISSN
jgi:hypothetical protein